MLVYMCGMGQETTSPVKFIGDVLEFSRWVGHAKPGYKAIYYEGNLARDRQTSRVLDRLALAVLKAAEKGHVRLFQEKRKFATTIYWAIKS